MSREDKVPQWYHGGLAAAGAACFTHPLDLLKVLLQTQVDKKLGMRQLAKEVIAQQGVRGLYNGISASILRQLCYSTTRFAIYEYVRQNYKTNTLIKRIVLAGGAGAVGGFVGTPADLVNVRMQNDMKLPPEKRRNYKNAIHGLMKTIQEEGIFRLFTGASTTAPRAAMMTIGQLATYDQFKTFLLTLPIFKDNVVTHLSASIMAGIVATILTQPIDIIKTRLMNAKPGEFKGPIDAVKQTAKKEGIKGFAKGIVPSCTRIVPTTILTFVFYEQLRLNFGHHLPPK